MGQIQVIEDATAFVYSGSNTGSQWVVERYPLIINKTMSQYNTQYKLLTVVSLATPSLGIMTFIPNIMFTVWIRQSFIYHAGTSKRADMKAHQVRTTERGRYRRSSVQQPTSRTDLHWFSATMRLSDCLRQGRPSKVIKNAWLLWPTIDRSNARPRSTAKLHTRVLERVLGSWCSLEYKLQGIPTLTALRYTNKYRYRPIFWYQYDT